MRRPLAFFCGGANGGHSQCVPAEATHASTSGKKGAATEPQAPGGGQGGHGTASRGLSIFNMGSAFLRRTCFETPLLGMEASSANHGCPTRWSAVSEASHCATVIGRALHHCSRRVANVRKRMSRESPRIKSLRSVLVPHEKTAGWPPRAPPCSRGASLLRRSGRCRDAALDGSRFFSDAPHEEFFGGRRYTSVVWWLQNSGWPAMV